MESFLNLFLLYTLRSDGLKPHSYSHVQYALLVLNGICKLELEQAFYGEAYRVKFNETPENNIAADIAEEMLRGESTSLAFAQEPETREFLMRGLFNYSSELRQFKSAEKFVAKDELMRLIELSHGVVE